MAAQDPLDLQFRGSHPGCFAFALSCLISEMKKLKQTPSTFMIDVYSTVVIHNTVSLNQTQCSEPSSIVITCQGKYASDSYQNSVIY